MLLGSVMASDSQTISGATRGSFYLDADKPGVYIQLLRSGPRPPRFSTEGPTGMWLRLRNNLKVPILLYAGAAANDATPWQRVKDQQVSYFKEGAEVSACYDVEGVPLLTTREKPGSIEVNVPVRAHSPEQAPITSCLWFPTDTNLISLAPGGSVVFSVPENFVTAGQRISTRFQYEMGT